jgi:hypothetical protein
MNRLLTVFVLSFLVVLPIRGHDLWIEPSSFTPAAGEIVALRLKVGEHFEGETVPRRRGRIERFFARSATGERDVPGQESRDPAGIFAVRDSGTTIVAYRSLPNRIELPAAKFESYLREEGLERIIEERKTRRESAKPGIEIYSRAVKSLLQSGGGELVDESLGLRLEVIRRGDRFQILFEGKPLANALVIAMRRGAASEALKARTNAEGLAAFPRLERGEWLVKTVHMIRAEPSVGADWESLWTSVTFAVP